MARLLLLLSLDVYVTTTGGSIATDTMTYEVTKSMVEDGSVAMSYNLYEMDAHRGVDQHGRALPRRTRRIGQDAREHAVRQDALAVVGANDAARPACAPSHRRGARPLVGTLQRSLGPHGPHAGAAAVGTLLASGSDAGI